MSPALLQTQVNQRQPAPQLRTPNDQKYHPTQQNLGRGGTTKYTVVTVRASSNANIGLFQRRLGLANIQRNNKNYEIAIGERNNQYTTIRKNGQQLARIRTPNILSANKAQDFWVSVDEDNGKIKFGKGNEFNKGEVMQATDNNGVLPINAVGAMTRNGATGRWDFPVIPESTDGDKMMREMSLENRGNWAGDVPTYQGKTGAMAVGGGAADAAPSFEANTGGAAAGKASAVPASWLDENTKDFGVMEADFKTKAAASKKTRRTSE